MNHSSRVYALMAIAVIVYAGVPAHAAAGRGSIRGVVMDSLGNPLIGAAVVVLEDVDAAKSDKIVRRASTDKEGKFSAAGIVPGRYRVKAEAEGFKPVELAAEVRPNKVTVFDSILLRRITALSDETARNADSKYAARQRNGTIFHYDDSRKETTAADPSVVLAARSTELHGAINAFAQTAPSAAGEPASFGGANFAVSEQIGREANLVVSGQLGYGNGAPQSLRTLTTAGVGNRHRVAVALGYGRFTFSRHSAIPKLGQFSVSATDTWQVSGPVLVVYGLEFARFAEGRSGTSVLPRLGIAIDAAAKTRLFAGLVPGSSGDVQSKVNLESGEIEFAEPKPVAFAGDQPVMERSYRLEFGAEQVLSDRSSVEMTAFFDTVSGHGVGLLAMANDSTPVLRTEQQAGRTRGLRVVYHRHLNRRFDTSVGYSFGEGQQLDGRGITTPASLFSNNVFHVVSAKVDANFTSTGTKVSTVLRLAPGQAVFAIDPFQGRMSTYDPNVSVSLTQELPSVSFIPGQWAAVVDLRNLFDQQTAVGDDRQELIASRFHRLIRVGVSLRF